MAIGTLSVVLGANSPIQDNTQRFQIFTGKLAVSAFADVYPVGGLELKNVLKAGLPVTTNSDPVVVRVQSASGSGYVYDYIKSTGKLMILQVPPTGSLTTAAPLQENPSGANSLSGPFEDVIEFEVKYLRNA